MVPGGFLSLACLPLLFWIACSCRLTAAASLSPKRHPPCRQYFKIPFALTMPPPE